MLNTRVRGRGRGVNVVLCCGWWIMGDEASCFPPLGLVHSSLKDSYGISNPPLHNYNMVQCNSLCVALCL